MRWAAKPKINPREWHPHFALWPRHIGDTYVWLETIERRVHYPFGFQYPYFEYQYREPA